MVKRWVVASTKVTDAWITQSKQEDLFLILITLVGVLELKERNKVKNK